GLSDQGDVRMPHRDKVSDHRPDDRRADRPVDQTQSPRWSGARYAARSSVRARRVEMMRIASWRYVIVACQIASPILTTTENRGSSVDRADRSNRSGSNHKACASRKSIPCLALLLADLAGSNSNRI